MMHALSRYNAYIMQFTLTALNVLYVDMYLLSDDYNCLIWNNRQKQSLYGNTSSIFCSHKPWNYLFEMLEQWARQLGSPVPMEFLRHCPMLHDCSNRNASLVFFLFFFLHIYLGLSPGLLGFRTIDDIECTIKSVHYWLIKWRCFVALELVSVFKSHFNEQKNISDIEKIIPRIYSLCVHEIPVQFSD